jgi:hypothetical protein
VVARTKVPHRGERIGYTEVKWGRGRHNSSIGIASEKRRCLAPRNTASATSWSEEREGAMRSQNALIGSVHVPSEAPPQSITSFMSMYNLITTRAGNPLLPPARSRRDQNHQPRVLPVEQSIRISTSPQPKPEASRNLFRNQIKHRQRLRRHHWIAHEKNQGDVA